MAAKMIRRVMVDQFLCENENISVNAAIVFDVILKLNSHSQIQKIKYEDKIYMVLYRNMILLQIKHFKISTRTLSSAIKELEDVGLIDCIYKNTTPAYRTTAKADEYNFLPNGGEFEDGANKPNKKQQLFSLAKKTRFDKLTKEYLTLLGEKANEYSEKVGVDFESTMQDFGDYHTARGNAFTNWLSAYKGWCRKKLSFAPKNKTNVGDYYSNLTGH